MVRAMYEVQLKDGKRAEDLMLGLNETIDQLAMANYVCFVCLCAEEGRRSSLEKGRVKA